MGLFGGAILVLNGVHGVDRGASYGAFFTSITMYDDIRLAYSRDPNKFPTTHPCRDKVTACSTADTLLLNHQCQFAIECRFSSTSRCSPHLIPAR